jgi:cell wall-associated NlpC family hydrolase
VNTLLDWAKSKKGTPYAAVNPFRFGTVPWDGQPHTSLNKTGTVYHYPKGTQVFDCSGFVVACYRQLGVDLAAHGLASSATINANSKGFLQDVPVSDLQPGDLITFNPDNGVGHVAIYEGDGKIMQCSGGKGVNEAPLDYANIQSVRRVPLP